MNENVTPKRTQPDNKSRMPKNSIFFEKMVPILLTGMGILAAVLILFALGVLLGFIRF